METIEWTDIQRTELLGRIREALVSNRIGGQKACKVAGLGAGFINDIRVGRSKNPSPLKLAQLARAIGCDEDWLIHGTAKNQPEISMMQIVKVADAIKGLCSDYPTAIAIATKAVEAMEPA